MSKRDNESLGEGIAVDAYIPAFASKLLWKRISHVIWQKPGIFTM